MTCKMQTQFKCNVPGKQTRKLSRHAVVREDAKAKSFYKTLQVWDAERGKG